MLYILIFAVLAGFIIMVGKKLSLYGDAIGDLMGIEKSWIGIVMLAAVTSLPEMVTSISATLMGNPQMAVANIFGSNLFNIFVVFIVDIFVLKSTSFSSKISSNNFMAGFWAIILTLVFLLGFLFPTEGIMNISLFSLIILGVYFIAMKSIYIYEHQKNDEFSEKLEEEIKEFHEIEEGGITLPQAKKGFAVNAFFVVVLGTGLSFIGDKIASTPFFGIELGESFVGLILIALATSLPELTVSIEAIKLKSYDMAAGNLLGSNIFNIMIIFITDLFLRDQNIYRSLGGFHKLTAIFSMLILLVFMMGIMFKNKKRRYDTYIIGMVYFVAMYILYIKR
jgi:cation:H+ antiporter